MFCVRLFGMVNSDVNHMGSKSKLNYKNVIFNEDCWMKPKYQLCKMQHNVTSIGFYLQL